jgi:general secretion pathway protein D
VFYTTGPRYEALLPLIRQLDVAPKQILLEATIAEVTLTGDFAFGVEFGLSRDVGPKLPENGLGRDTISGGSLGLMNLPGGTLAVNYITNVTDQIKLRLQSNDSRVNVLSSPFMLVRDGMPATITVGNDVPTVGATSSDPVLSERTVTSIAYRRTGLNLTITPKINSSDTVVLQISQSISNSVPGSAISGAPIFFDRQLETEVIARSGQTVLLAGLISESQSDSSSNIPWVSRLPLIGAAFRSDSKKKEKTELLLLLTPRVVESPDEWPAVRASIEKALQYLDLGNLGQADR